MESRQTKRRLPGAIHHLVSQETIPRLLWGLEAWWTRAQHIVNLIQPTYHALARVITSLLKWAPLLMLYAESGLPPLHLLLDRNSRQYGIRILLAKDDHPAKSTLRALMLKPTLRNGTGLQRIANLLDKIAHGGPHLEDTTDASPTTLPDSIIPEGTKEHVARGYNEWDQRQDFGTIYLFTDRSKNADGTCGSWWVAARKTVNGNEECFRGKCQIGGRAEIENAEIHAIEEGLKQVVRSGLQAPNIYICADNQNTLRALSGAQTGNREFGRKCLEDVKALYQNRCIVQGKWTPFHSGIPLNEQADELANEGCKQLLCQGARTTVTWL